MANGITSQLYLLYLNCVICQMALLFFFSLCSFIFLEFEIGETRCGCGWMLGWMDVRIGEGMKKEKEKETERKKTSA